MRRIPQVKIEDVYPDLGLTGTHPAFIVNGVEKSELFISVYPATILDNVGVSLPGQDPAQNMTFDQAMAYCKNKGAGWHLMTNVEWALLQALGIKTGFQPHGNTYWGLNYDLKYETGTLAPGAASLGVRDDTKHGRTLTGSGPLSWRHDNSPSGIADLVGNVWEWTGGLRLNAGEINIIPDNDAAASNVNMAANSSQWRALLQNGNRASPGTANALRYNGVSSTAGIKMGAGAESQTVASSAWAQLRNVLAEDGISIPPLARLLGLFPVDSENPVGTIYITTVSECMAWRGGAYNNASACGLFSLGLNIQRTTRFRWGGFRSAFMV